ncbi:MAG: hypothetical protein ACQESR_23830, partial [Planctomycetota bacterium]
REICGHQIKYDFVLEKTGLETRPTYTVCNVRVYPLLEELSDTSPTNGSTEHEEPVFNRTILTGSGIKLVISRSWSSVECQSILMSAIMACQATIGPGRW